MKPRIGIPANILTSFSNDFNGLPITYTPHGFVQALQRADALPVLLPMSGAETAADYLKGVDALVFAGGQDVTPTLYGEEPSLKLGPVSPDRDAFELALIKEAWEQKKSILAVCRGLQIVNVGFGGTLYQDLSDYPNLKVQHVQKSLPYTGVHTVAVEDGSWTSNVFGTTYPVNSYHHQAIKDLADPFKAVAWSRDGLIEAIEAKDSSRLTIGIQWHPELMIDRDKKMQGLFDTFVESVRTIK